MGDAGVYILSDFTIEKNKKKFFSFLVIFSRSNFIKIKNNQLEVINNYPTR